MADAHSNAERISKERTAQSAGDGDGSASERSQTWEELDAEMAKTLKSCGLEARIDCYKGRCIYAAKTFQPGEVILKQQALAFTLFNNEQGASVRCHWCLKLSEKLRRCSRCKYAHYCSEEHQRRAWKLHAPECKRLAKFAAEGRQPTPMVLMMSRVIDAKEREAAGKEAPLVGRRHADLTTLASHYGEHPQESMVGFASLAQVLRRYMGWEEEEEGEGASMPEGGWRMREVVEGFCRLACNSHSITDVDLRPFGIGCFPLAALVNHSCRPNAVQTYRGSEIVFRAMQRIEPGSEVSISYVDVASPNGSRSHELASRYLFKCACSACESPDSEGEAVKEATLGDEAACRTARRLGQEATRAVKDKAASCQELLVLLTEAIAASERVLHPLNVDLMRLREHATRVAVQEQEWEAALTHCDASIPAYRRHYAAGSPVLGMQLLMQGKLLSYLTRHGEARGPLAEGVEIVRRAYGPDSEAVEEGERLLREAQWTLQGLGQSD